MDAAPSKMRIGNCSSAWEDFDRGASNQALTVQDRAGRTGAGAARGVANEYMPDHAVRHQTSPPGDRGDSARSVRAGRKARALGCGRWTHDHPQVSRGRCLCRRGFGAAPGKAGQLPTHERRIPLHQFTIADHSKHLPFANTHMGVRVFYSPPLKIEQPPCSVTSRRVCIKDLRLIASGARQQPIPVQIHAPEVLDICAALQPVRAFVPRQPLRLAY